MIYFTLVALAGALIYALFLLARHNRRLRELREAIRAEQPLLREDTDGLDLAEWTPLTTSVNELIADTSALRRRQTDQLNQLEATFGALREAVLIVDESNYVHLANRAMREIFPHARELVNLRLELIVRSAAFLEFVRATRAGQELPRQEFEIMDGTRSTWIEVSGAPIPAPDGKGRWALFVLHDVTQQRVLERTRRDFVANASHELRTPLTLIKGYVETLVDGHTTMPEEDREKFLRTIQRHSERLNRIISDLLTLSRLESTSTGTALGPLALAPFLENLVADAAQSPSAAKHQLSASIEPELGEIEADAERLTQVFTNLLENAVKYSPAGSRVELVARALKAGGEIEVVVRDNGPGIPAEDLPHIFERFYRVEKGRSRESGGTGLGLSIVKHAVQLHGGKVWAESVVGQGTAVFVRLPRGAARSKA